MRKSEEKKRRQKCFTVCVRVFEYMYASVAYPGMHLCIMEKKEKTAYLEYTIKKKFDIIKFNISQRYKLIKTITQTKFYVYHSHYINKVYDTGATKYSATGTLLHNTNFSA